jgi:HNH endonuclease
MHVDARGYVIDGGQYVHRRIAEAVVGRRLSRRVCVHHFDGNKSNNAHTNLVICPHAGYHHLLEVHRRVQLAGGDCWTQRLCIVCVQPKVFADFERNTKRGGKVCRACAAAYQRHRRRGMPDAWTRTKTGAVAIAATPSLFDPPPEGAAKCLNFPSRFRSSRPPS